MPVRHPVFIKRLSAPGAEAFAILYAIESMSRAVLSAVIPIEALRLLGDAKGVSLIFFAVSLLSLCASLSVPWLIRRTARRVVYTAGFLMLAVAPVLLAQASPGWLFAGMICRALAVVSLSICLSLYILDFIRRHDFVRSEPMRLFYSAGAWCAGPFLGVYLAETVDPWAPYVVSLVCAVTALAYFWFLRIGDHPAVQPARRPAPSPLNHVRRYFSQPRLALAWVLSMGRNVWWVVFFIYAPIYAVEAGLGELAGGAIVSLGTGFLFLMPVMGRLVRRFGLRAVYLGAFAVAGLLTLAVPLVQQAPVLGAMLMVTAAFGMTAIDAGGNLLFMFAVKRRERDEMTTVYSTFRDVADIAPPGIFSILLRFFELSAVFIVAGATVLSLAALSTRIHPRLGRQPQARRGPTGPVSQETPTLSG
jgi:MFS family permease